MTNWNHLQLNKAIQTVTKYLLGLGEIASNPINFISLEEIQAQLRFEANEALIPLRVRSHKS